MYETSIPFPLSSVSMLKQYQGSMATPAPRAPEWPMATSQPQQYRSQPVQQPVKKYQPPEWKDTYKPKLPEPISSCSSCGGESVFKPVSQVPTRENIQNIQQVPEAPERISLAKIKAVGCSDCNSVEDCRSCALRCPDCQVNPRYRNQLRNTSARTSSATTLTSTTSTSWSTAQILAVAIPSVIALLFIILFAVYASKNAQNKKALDRVKTNDFNQKYNTQPPT